MEIPEENKGGTVAIQAQPTLKTESAVSTAIAKFKVENETAVALREFFEPLERQVAEWKEKAFALVITDASQTEEIKQAREARLSVRQVRLSIEKLHKEKKEDSLKKGQLLDLIKRTLVDLVEPIETHLKKQEDFVELQERRRVEDLHKSRLAELEPYRVPGDNLDMLALGEMSEVVFNGIKSGVIAAQQQREQEKADQEKATREKEESAKKERERIAEENEKLKVYNERIQSLTTIGFVWSASGNTMEHAGIGYGFSKFQLENLPDSQFDPLFDDISSIAMKWNNEQAKKRADYEAAAAELKARQEREALEQKQRALDEKKKARAPDKTKLLAMAEAIKNIEQPELKTEDGKAVLLNVKTLLAKVHKYINDQCANL